MTDQLLQTDVFSIDNFQLICYEELTAYYADDISLETKHFLHYVN